MRQSKIQKRFSEYKRVFYGNSVLYVDILYRKRTNEISHLQILVKFFYNTNGVGMWTLLPGQIGPEFGCDFLNDGYKRYLPGLPEASNFPKVGDDYYCPLQKVCVLLNLDLLQNSKNPPKNKSTCSSEH